jgi:nicotinate phosphoribosyltransferase
MTTLSLVSILKTNKFCFDLQVEELYHVVWEDGQNVLNESLESARQNVQESLKVLRPDHRRSLNPTPYKVSVSDQLYKFVHQLWLENAPIGELS